MRHRQTLLFTLFVSACGAAHAPTTAPAHGGSAPADAHGGHAHGDAAHGGHVHGYAKDFSSSDAYARMFDSKERDAWQKPEEVARIVDVRTGALVADIGAGTGYFLGTLSAAVGSTGKVLALDSEPKMVEHMQHRIVESGWTNVEARLISPSDPGLAAASVDRILIVNTWHHISDRAAYAAKLHSALRPGGVVAIVDFTQESDMGPPPEHRLTAEAVVTELSAGGLAAQVVEETLPKQYLVLGRAR